MDSKKLCKSRNDKYIGGVCAGLGNYFDFDPTIIRLATVLLGFASSGIVIIAYIVLCFVLPYEDSEYKSNNYTTYTTTTESNNSTRNKLGIFLIFVGIILFLRKILPLSISRFMFPIIILVAGIILILSAYMEEHKRVKSYDNTISDGIFYEETTTESTEETKRGDEINE